MKTSLSHSQQKTRDAIFVHPISHNLKWADVHSLLLSLAEAVDEHGDVLKVARHGKTLILHKPTSHSISDANEVMKIRHFIDEPAPKQPQVDENNPRILVVLDHRLARVFRSQEPQTVPIRIPLDPDQHSVRHLRHVENDATGQRWAEPASFYREISTHLREAKEILLMGSGTGSSSAMEQLMKHLQEHEVSAAGRVVGCVVVNEQHMSEAQLLAKSREEFEKVEV